MKNNFKIKIGLYSFFLIFDLCAAVSINSDDKFQNLQKSFSTQQGQKQIFVDVYPPEDQDPLENLRTLNKPEEKYGFEDLSEIIEKVIQKKYGNFIPTMSQPQMQSMYANNLFTNSQNMPMNMEPLFNRANLPKFRQIPKEKNDVNLKEEQQKKQNDQNENIELAEESSNSNINQINKNQTKIQQLKDKLQNQLKKFQNMKNDWLQKNGFQQHKSQQGDLQFLQNKYDQKNSNDQIIQSNQSSDNNIQNNTIAIKINQIKENQYKIDQNQNKIEQIKKNEENKFENGPLQSQYDEQEDSLLQIL